MMGMGINETAEAIMAGIGMLLAWRAGEIKKEDKEVIEAHEFVMDSLSDADLMNRADLATGKNLREQLTVEQTIELDREVKLLKMGNTRN